MSVIEVKDLTFSYDGETPAVQGVSFTVEKGSYTTLIGHNGSGKSTVAKLLAGLLEKEKPFTLPWSHYLQLMRIKNENERRFYEIEATKGTWSIRTLSA